jgi:UDP-GlcNAc:undecaprenyl-phosphate/decaprenyl-phosphate GlcNAc-1-phosphate transferase
MLLAASLLALGSLVCALILTPLTRDLFNKLGFVDRPTGGRKLHATPIPRIGGIAIVASILLSAGLTSVFGIWAPLAQNASIQFLIRLLPAAAIIFLIGVLDDFFTLKPWQKLLGQFIGAGTAYACGLRVMVVAGYSAESWLTLPLTLGWLLLCTNAFNLIDGIDGLAAGAGLFATLTILLAGVIEKNAALVLAAAPLGAALLGFLRYNFNPATAFLGDSGSLLLGFLLGCFGVIWSFKTATVFGMVAPLMTMCVPILDVALSVTRRFIRGKPIFGADRRHMHHRLLDRGLGPKRVVFLLYGACAVGAVLSLLQTVQHNRYSSLVIFLFCAGTWIGIQHLKYPEFLAFRSMLFGGALQRMIDANVQLRDFEFALGSCKTFDEWLEQLYRQCRTIGVAAVELNFGGQIFERMFAPTSHHCWSVIVPIGDDASLHLSLPPGATQTATAIMPMAELISRKLPEKFRSVRYAPIVRPLSAAGVEQRVPASAV